MYDDRRRIWAIAIVIGMLVWSLVVVWYVADFDVLLSDDPQDGGANMAAQLGEVMALVVWLVPMLLGVGLLVGLWRGRRPKPPR